MRSESRFEVCLSNLNENIALIKQCTGQKKILLMIKADAYGHGMIPVIEQAYSQGVSEFGCASLGEALYLRHNLPDLEFEIFVFSELDFVQDQAHNYKDYRIIPVLSHLEDVRFFLSEPELKNVPVVLKLNTGMNRLGLLKEDLEITKDLLLEHGRNEIFHLMSHFANSSLEIKEKCMTTRQYQEFKESKDFFIHAGIKVENSSMANSGAIEQGYACQEETHVRPGIVAYGASSLIPKLRKRFPWKGKLVSSLKTKIFRKFDLKKGDPLGYGAVVVPHDCVIVLLPIGYGDGLFRSLEKCKIRLNSVEGIFFGRLNMDMVSLMFSKENGQQLKVGDPVDLWSYDSESLFLLSDQLGTISYEILCHIGQRVPRIYV